MSLVNLQNATVQPFLEIMGLKSCSPPSEIGIAEILAAEALLQLRGSGTKCPPQNCNCCKSDKATQTDILLESLVLSEIQNGGTPLKAVIQKIGDIQQFEVSTATPAGVDLEGSIVSTPERRTRRRKRTHTSTSESSDQSFADSFNVQPKKTCGSDMVRIGDGNAVVPKKVFTNIKWESYTSATRKLLTAVFPRNVLATHSLTGKRSPAFPNKAAKEKLDPYLVNDIVKTVVSKCGVAENIVRTAITTKCADESKMLRNRQKHYEDEEEE